jgi:hypothetical protein
MGTGGPFPRGKARPGRDADHSPPSSTEVVNELELYLLFPQEPPWRVAGLLLLFYQLTIRDQFSSIIRRYTTSSVQTASLNNLRISGKKCLPRNCQFRFNCYTAVRLNAMQLACINRFKVFRSK